MFSLLIDETDYFNFTDLTELVSIIIYDIIFCGVHNSGLKVFCFTYYILYIWVKAKCQCGHILH